MNMHYDEYEKLINRFMLEIKQVGVTDDMLKGVESSFRRTPNLVSIDRSEEVSKFIYRFGGYEITAARVVKLSLRAVK